MTSTQALAVLSRSGHTYPIAPGRYVRYPVKGPRGLYYPADVALDSPKPLRIATKRGLKTRELCEQSCLFHNANAGYLREEVNAVLRAAL